MAGDNKLTVDYRFRGVEYMVTLHNTGTGPTSTLMLQVEDRLGADQWRGTFDSSYIEDLSHKTGNYKQYSIFVSMLESAMKQESDVVSLDLLTYSDLEALRNRKAGGGTKIIPAARVPALSAKRYLILTYTVEFDRIHYPLPLPYVGKADPLVLQETIRQLREQLKISHKQSKTDYRTKELDKLRQRYEILGQEKDDMEASFMAYRRSVEHTSSGHAAKEIKILKGVAKTLEEDLMKEQAKHSRMSNKRNQEYRRLIDEVEELRSSERNLRVRVKSLTNERMGRALANQSELSSRRNSSNTTSYRDRSSSRENSQSRNTSRLSGTSSRWSSKQKHPQSRDTSQLSGASSRYSYHSRDNSNLSNRSAESYSSRSRARERSHKASSSVFHRPASRDRSISFDRGLPPRPRSTSHDRSNFPTSVSFRSRTPSPMHASSGPRFNPTAYIREKAQKQIETDKKTKRRTKSRMNRSGERRPRSVSDYTGHSSNRSRDNSIGSLRSRTSSIESLSDIGIASDASETRRRTTGKSSRPGSAGSSRSNSSAAWESGGPLTKKYPNGVLKNTKKKKVPTATLR